MSALTALEIEKLLPATFTAPGLSEAEFLELCAKFPEDMVEYWADGTVIIMPPTNSRSAKLVAQVVAQLVNWASTHGGYAFGSDAGFRFRDGSLFAPDASWCQEARWDEAMKSAATFPVLAPEFVIEVRSLSDPLWRLRNKMETYIANGVQLAWLIDPIERTVTIYRPGQPEQTLTSPASVEGEGPVAGFVLNLERVFGE